jgi:hypothetical protein
MGVPENENKNELDPGLERRSRKGLVEFISQSPPAPLTADSFSSASSSSSFSSSSSSSSSSLSILSHACRQGTLTRTIHLSWLDRCKPIYVGFGSMGAIGLLSLEFAARMY